MKPKAFSVKELFGVPAPDELTVIGFDTTHLSTPKVDKGYVFRRDITRELVAWYQNSEGEGLSLKGPLGSGKSSIIKQFAARLNLPFQFDEGYPGKEFSEFVGSKELINGSTVFVPGPLTIAMKEGHMFLLDEFDLVDPGVCTALNPIIEGSPLTISQTGEVIYPKPGFCFIVTSNTGGGGDDTGLYQGTLRQNISHRDRYWKSIVDYLDADTELKVIKAKVPDMATSLATKMIKVAEEIRKMFMGISNELSGLSITLSTRTLIRWAKTALIYKAAPQPLYYSMDIALTNDAKPEERHSIFAIIQRIIPEAGPIPST